MLNIILLLWRKHTWKILCQWFICFSCLYSSVCYLLVGDLYFLMCVYNLMADETLPPTSNSTRPTQQHHILFLCEVMVIKNRERWITEIQNAWQLILAHERAYLSLFNIWHLNAGQIVWQWSHTQIDSVNKRLKVFGQRNSSLSSRLLAFLNVHTNMNLWLQLFFTI